MHTALAYHHNPRAVIGDMDPIGTLDQLGTSIELIHQAGQDDTDFEKCLKLIDAPLIVGFGFLGARNDHMLAVLHTLASLTDSRPVILVGQDDVMLRCAVIVSFICPLIRGFPYGHWAGRISFNLRGLPGPLTV